MKKLSKVDRAKEFLTLTKQANKLDKKLDILNNKRYDLYLSPFKTWGTRSNAGYCLSGVLNNPDHAFTTPQSLLNARGTSMCWSQETLSKQAPRIFKHFIETGLLVKSKCCYKLNPNLRGYRELKKEEE